MPTTQANGLQIHYDEHGDPAAPPVLLVMGLGAQMTLWPMELVDALVARGHRVIRYDNRDIGLSEKFDGVKGPGILKMVIWSKLGLPIRSPYTLSDMAADGIGLLDALDIERAHVVGASMGGMIVQTMAIEHSNRLASMTSIMSTTGNRKLPQATPKAMKALTQRPKSMEEDVLVEHGMSLWRTIGSPDYPLSDERLRSDILSTIRRSTYPEGMPRQLAAIVADGCRRERLKAVEVPSLVIHGEADPLVPLPGGEDTAAHIPGARLKTFPGMGHDLPLELVDPMADAIAEHAKTAAGKAGGTSAA
uniref:alpha/beta fold hydrolase n=1 Tax=Parerythrobacter lutipelagi TaxID=1964208 RepID=UPI0010F58C24|nr:alpha/beta hydrolase [Parerythrobacter lutipelagi]